MNGQQTNRPGSRSDVKDTVRAAAKEAEGFGTLLDGHVAGRRSLFEDVFKEMPAAPPPPA